MKQLIKKILLLILKYIPYFNIIYYTKNTSTPITIKILFFQKLLGFNRGVYWPTHYTSKIVGHKNIIIGIETCPGYMPNCYIQGKGKIEIGDYTQIAPSVGIISANHDFYDNKKSIVKDVKIGRYCWLGMGSIVLPGVHLGNFTIVAAGSVVTKSFSEGYCVIGGNPAKKIKDLDRTKCKEFESQYKYNGYIKNENFEMFIKNKLNV